MFWGLIMEPQKRYSQVVKKSFHISMAALDINSSSEDAVQVMCGFENRKYLLCTLQKDKILQVTLDLNFEAGDEISFITNGTSHVHLTGYLNDDPMDALDDLGEEEEEPAEELEVLGNISASNIVAGKRPKKKASPTDDSPPPTKKTKTLKLLEEVNSQEEDDSDDSTVMLSDAIDEEEEDSAIMDSEEEVEDENDEDEAEDEEEGDEEEDDEEAEDEEEEDDDDEDDEISSMSDDQDEKEQAKPKMNGVSKKQQQQAIATKEKSKQEIKAKGDKKKQQPPTKKPENGASPQKKTVEGGVSIEDITVGSGQVAKPGKMVQVYYEGRFKNNNKVFDSTSKGNGFKFRLGKQEVIKGWDVGVAGMKVGGKRRIVCPPSMAYGARGSPPTIPPNSTLVFTVELKNVN